MTGRIISVVKLSTINDCEIAISFIDSKYFENEMKIGNRITIQEASRILGEGVITRL